MPSQLSLLIPLGNQTTVGTAVIKIDLETAQQHRYLPQKPPKGFVTGGTVTFKFSEDPGLSGNDLLILPDGSEVKIDGDFTWNSVQDGVYNLYHG